MGDFTGFSFGDWSSTDPQHGVVKVLRVSGGDRYNETLHPEIKDRTAEVPGVNGEYYFGSDYGTRTFDIDIAFDSLTEEQFRELRKVFGTKDIKKLVFDERPYKYYMAKLGSPIELSYVCFDGLTREPFSQGHFSQELPDGVRMITDNEGNRVREKVDPWVYSEQKTRIYKGEGTISFVCYFPFAKSVFKEIPSTYEGSDWVISSGLLTHSERAAKPIDEYIAAQDEGVAIIKTYNPGDVATGIRLFLPATTVTDSITRIRYRFLESTASDTTALLELKQMELKTGDIGVLVDTNNELIIGVSSPPQQGQDGNWTYITSGNLYNQYINSGYFFKLEPNNYKTYSSITVRDNATADIRIFYDYLYF